MPDTPPLRILVLTRKPDSASYEHRVRRQAPLLESRGLVCTQQVIPRSVMGQIQLAVTARRFDVVLLHRHLLQQPALQVLRSMTRRLLFDFDDPLIHSARDGGRPSLVRQVRFAAVLRRCDAVTCASEHLAALARRYCRSVHVVPMAVDAPRQPDLRLAQREGAAALLWLGSRSTQPYLQEIAGVLAGLGADRPQVHLRLVAHEPMQFGTLPVDFRPWSAQEQARALAECDIGLCPMPDTPWTRGKCPYKVLQYMAAGLPWVGSAVGENVAVAGNGARGLTAADDASWMAALARLIDEPQLRRDLGAAGRRHVQEHHDREVLAAKLSAALRGHERGSADDQR